jgi:hypothetical protein
MWGVTDTQGLISKGRLTYSWLVMWGVTDTQKKYNANVII